MIESSRARQEYPKNQTVHTRMADAKVNGGEPGITPQTPTFIRPTPAPVAHEEKLSVPERGMEWAQFGTYLMNYDSDIASGDVTELVPSGGGSIMDLECGLGGPWSAGYSRIYVGGDLPGFQADLHLNYRLPENWTFQIGTSMGEIAQFPGGPLRNDFSGVTYALIKSFRISRQWTFQASYTNVPNRSYVGPISRPVRSRFGYHLLTLSYTPTRSRESGHDASGAKNSQNSIGERPRKKLWPVSLDLGILRLTDIRPIGFSYLYAGLSYRFRVPRLLKRF